MLLSVSIYSPNSNSSSLILHTSWRSPRYQTRCGFIPKREAECCEELAWTLFFYSFWYSLDYLKSSNFTRISINIRFIFSSPLTFMNERLKSRFCSAKVIDLIFRMKIFSIVILIKAQIHNKITLFILQHKFEL